MAGRLRTTTMILHGFFPKHTIDSRLRAKVNPFVRKERNDLAGWHTGEFRLFDCKEDFFAFLLCQLISRSRTYSFWPEILKRSCVLFQVHPPEICTFCYTDFQTGFGKAGTVVYSFFDQLYCFFAI